MEVRVKINAVPKSLDGRDNPGLKRRPRRGLKIEKNRPDRAAAKIAQELMGRVDAGDAPPRCPPPPGRLHDPQDAASLLQVQAQAPPGADLYREKIRLRRID